MPLKHPSLTSPVHHRRIRLVMALLFCCVVTVLLMVGLAPAAPPALRVAVGPWLGYDPLVLLREHDLLPPGVRLIELPSATDTQAAFREGRVDVAAVTLDEALRLQRRVPALRVIAVLSESRGADGVILRRGLEVSAGLRGRRILVEDSAVGRLMLAAALRAEGLALEQVDIVQVQAVRIAQRWAAGDADAVVTYEPVLSELRGQGHVLLHSTRELPGLIYDVLVARQVVLEARADDLAHLLMAWELGVGRFTEPAGPPAALLSLGTGLDEAQYRQALEGIALFDTQRSHALLTRADPALGERLPELGVLLAARGEIIAPPAVASLLAPEPQSALVRRIEEEAAHAD